MAESNAGRDKRELLSVIDGFYNVMPSEQHQEGDDDDSSAGSGYGFGSHNHHSFREKQEEEKGPEASICAALLHRLGAGEERRRT